MTAVQQIKAETRDKAGTGAARGVRRAGMVPGIVYGAGQTPQMVALDPRDLMKGLHRSSFYAALIDLEVAGKAVQVLPKKVQYHPVSDAPIHVDFLRVDTGTRVRVAVAVKLTGQEKSKGLKMGGVLNIVRHTVEVNCPAGRIPETFEIDISEAKIGEAVKSDHITLPEGASFAIRDRDFTIATIAAPKGMTVEEEEQQAASEATKE